MSSDELVTSADVAGALGWRWPDCTTVQRILRARRDGWLVAEVVCRGGAAPGARFRPVELTVAATVDSIWPVDGYGVTYRGGLGDVNRLRALAGEAVRARPEGLLVVDHEEGRAFTTDDPADVLGRAGLVTVAPVLVRELLDARQ